jgi:hypothetical protein
MIHLLQNIRNSTIRRISKCKYWFYSKNPWGEITLTADAYIVKLKTVVLTDQFSRPGGTPVAGSPAAQLNALFDSANATAATFLQMQ